MNPLFRSRLRLLAAFYLLALMLVFAACSGDDESADQQATAGSESADPPAQAQSADAENDTPTIAANPDADDPPGVILPTRFQNDPALEARLSPDALGLPARFSRIVRDDREPILTLGLVEATARLTFAVTTTHEIVSVDLLRLERQVDSEEFFNAFAETVADTPDYRGIDLIGVPRGVGDRARHLSFTVDDDDGDAVILLRDDLLAFLTYRRPPNLRQPLDVADLMRAIDAALQAPALATSG